MNNDEPVTQLSTLSVCALGAAFLLMTAAASAQTANAGAGQSVITPSHASAATEATQAGGASSPVPAQGTPSAEKEEEVYDLPHQVGDATSSLFAWQRSGEIASQTARPISGGVAGRSYERYLKSFEYPIPERLGSSVSNAKNGGSGASSAGSR
ncbi:DUF3613 domain-containing protein [Variovorax paradoxus]|uniref:DUF3613 domain-containing protein n=1 Tax=Variovorax paradoxus TaxID=34073 RepID=UPI0039994926